MLRNVHSALREECDLHLMKATLQIQGAILSVEGGYAHENRGGGGDTNKCGV